MIGRLKLESNIWAWLFERQKKKKLGSLTFYSPNNFFFKSIRLNIWHGTAIKYRTKKQFLDASQKMPLPKGSKINQNNGNCVIVLFSQYFDPKSQRSIFQKRPRYWNTTGLKFSNIVSAVPSLDGGSTYHWKQATCMLLHTPFSLFVCSSGR